MFCRNVKKNLSAYLQNELELGTRNSIRLHLERCTSCRRELEKIQDGIRMAEYLQIVPAPEELWRTVEGQLRKRQIGAEPLPRRRVISTAAISFAIIIILGVFVIWFFRTSDENRNAMSSLPQWSVNATVMEACSCPLMCQCYFNTKPAGHGHQGMEEHYCRTNVAYKINSGKYGSETLDGVKFWLAADVGSDFSSGHTDWAVLYFDRSLNARQREAVQTILSNLMPVKWKSFQTAEAKIDRWEVKDDSAYASLDSGNAAVIQLKRFAGMSSAPVIIQNLKYWGAPRNDGFLLMHNELEAYRVGPKAFEFKGTAGLIITFDMNSKDMSARKQQVEQNSSEKRTQPSS